MFFNVVACCMTMQHIIMQYYGFRTSYHDGIHFEKSFFLIWEIECFIKYCMKIIIYYIF